MSEKSHFTLHSVSVVVTAEFHNPSILNPDFLASHEIVPKDWVAAERLTTPPVSVVKYDNGVDWTVDQSQLAVTEKVGPAFGDSYRIHALAVAYLRTLPHVPYRSLGLNCRVSRQQQQPRRWLLERFGARWLSDEPAVLAMTPTFALDAGDAVCHIGAAVSSENDARIVLDCNLHLEGPQNVDGLCAAIGRWPERQAFIVEALAMLLGRRQA